MVRELNVLTFHSQRGSYSFEKDFMNDGFLKNQLFCRLILKNATTQQLIYIVCTELSKKAKSQFQTFEHYRDPLISGKGALFGRSKR